MYYFTDDCLIGVEQIDNEHRRLFNLISDVQALLANEYIEDKHDQICAMIDQLGDYAEEHFRHEEEYMEQINHPELELQKEQHLEFSVKIREWDAVVDGQDQQALLSDLVFFLVKWLYRHIIGSDLMIGKMITPEEWKKNTYGFTDKYLTGIEIIDEEHKELFRIIEEVQQIIKNNLLFDKYDQIISLIDDLRNYTKDHFKDEEEYMASIGHDGLEAQKVAHELFISRLDTLDMKDIDTNQEEILEEIMAFLTEWLVNHILNMDKKIPLVR